MLSTYLFVVATFHKWEPVECFYKWYKDESRRQHTKGKVRLTNIYHGKHHAICYFPAKKSIRAKCDFAQTCPRRPRPPSQTSYINILDKFELNSLKSTYIGTVTKLLRVWWIFFVHWKWQTFCLLLWNSFKAVLLFLYHYMAIFNIPDV